MEHSSVSFTCSWMCKLLFQWRCFNADPNNRGTGSTCLIFLICDLSAFTKAGMAAQLAWVHTLGHWRCFLGRDETARNPLLYSLEGFQITQHLPEHRDVPAQSRLPGQGSHQGKQQERDTWCWGVWKVTVTSWSLSGPGNVHSWKAAEGDPPAANK